MTLCDLLQEAARDTTLDFLVDMNGGRAVEKFRYRVPPSAGHLHERGARVRRRASDPRKDWGVGKSIAKVKPFHTAYANSLDEPAIQLSDVLCGILGKHFSCMEKLSIERLEAWHSKLSDKQGGNATLRSPVDRQGRRGMPSIALQPGAQR